MFDQARIIFSYNTNRNTMKIILFGNHGNRMYLAMISNSIFITALHTTVMEVSHNHKNMVSLLYAYDKIQ